MKIDKTLFRELTFERNAINETERTLEIAFSSEAPVERWFGTEILDHSPKSVDLGRLNNGGAVLWGHNGDQLVGVVESARIDNDRRGRALIRFADTPDVENLWQKVRQGIARHVSVGYRIDDLVMEKEDKTGATYRATRWTPFEVSIVSVPADASVGVGRSKSGENTMTVEVTKPVEQPETRAVDAADIAKQVAAELRADAEAKATVERKRCADLRDLGKEFGRESLAAEAIEGGKSVDEFRTLLLNENKEAFRAPLPKAPEAPRIEMNYQHTNKLRAFGADKVGLEAAYRAGQWARAVVFGDEKAARWCRDYGVRVMTGLTSGTASVVPEEMVQPIIDLREQYGVARQECYVHPMSTDTATVPRRKSGVTAYFVGREDATTASDAAFDDINLVAREVAALTRISRSYAEDAIIDLGEFLATEMAYAFAVKEDDCLFNGDGSSTYGGIYGIRPKLIDGTHTAGAIDAASGNDTFAEITASDLLSVEGALPEFPGIMAKWYVSKKGRSLMFDRLAAAAGGNTKRTLSAEGPVREWNGSDIVISQAMPKVATDLSDVVMAVHGDLRMGVTFGDRRGFEVEILRERYAEYRQIGIQATERFDIVVHGLGDTSNAGPIVGLVGE